MTIEIEYMQRSLMLAELGRHTCRPNPLVGCVIVQGKHIVGEGWHQVAGQAHAEINALSQAGEMARGAIAYVTLEPCAHQGRTGPCAEALIKAGVAEVVFGMQDPNPLVSGQGLQKMRDAGIKVQGPVLEEQARALNPGFINRMQHKLPYVRCKLGMSLDARTAMASGESQWITGPQAREDVQQFRARSCAILTGIGTVLADNPMMNVRLDGFQGKQPLRVIVDSKGRIPVDSNILSGPNPVLVVTATESITGLPEHVQVLSLPAGDGHVDLSKLLAYLAAEKHCNEVLLEAGPLLSGAMLTAGLVDELLTYIAPVLLGSEARPMAMLPGLERLDQGLAMTFQDVAMLGKDCRIRSLLTKIKQ